MAVVDIPSSGWTAGGTYTRTVAQALGSQSAARADVDVFRISSDPRLLEGVVVQALPPRQQELPLEAVARRLAGRAIRTRPIPGERRLRQALRLSDANDPVWVAERRGMDVAFPVLGVPRVKARIGLVGWIPDLQHIHFPQFFSATEVNSRDRQFALLAQRCHAVVFSSETVRGEFEAHFPGFGSKCKTVRFPSRYIYEEPKRVAVRKIYQLPEHYLLCANQFWRHKNHMMVVDAMRIAVDSNPEVVCVFTGLPVDGRDPNNSYFSEFLQSVAVAGLTNNVRILGLVPKSHLDALMLDASALVQPSLSEGWNTSVEDAKALRTPVIAYDTAVLREQAPHGQLVTQAEEFAGAIVKAITDVPLGSVLDAGRDFAESTAAQFGPLLLEICLEAASDAQRCP